MHTNSACLISNNQLTNYLHSNRQTNSLSSIIRPMDSLPSTSNHHHRRPIKVAQPVADRIIRALRHRLLLLHRSGASDFFVLGATGNVYTVSLSSAPTCTCPDRTTPCKHILFVLIRVLGVPLDDGCLCRRTLRQCQLSRLLGTPTSPDSLAGPALRERFSQLFLLAVHNNNNYNISGNNPVQVQPTTVEEGTTCPVCLEEMGKEERVVACRTCRNLIHDQCLMTWKKMSGRRWASCVICRARWRDRAAAEEKRYLNLSAYVSQDEVAAVGGDHSTGSLSVD